MEAGDLVAGPVIMVAVLGGWPVGCGTGMEAEWRLVPSSRGAKVWTRAWAVHGFRKGLRCC